MRRKAAVDKDVRGELIRSYREEGLFIATQYEGLGVEGLVNDVLDLIRALHEGEDCIVEGWRLEDALFDLGIGAETRASRYVVHADGTWDVMLNEADTATPTAATNAGADTAPPETPPSATGGMNDPSDTDGPGLAGAQPGITGRSAVAKTVNISPPTGFLRTKETS